MTGFVKLDCGILDSSLWIDRDQRSLFLTALLMATPIVVEEALPALHIDRIEPTGFVVPPGRYGFVRSAASGLIRRDGLPMDVGLRALAALCAPDPESRTPEFEGRRMARVDGGFIVLNYMVYRDMDYTAAERMRRMRARRKGDDVTVLRRNPVTACNSYASASSSAFSSGSSTTANQEKKPVKREEPEVELTTAPELTDPVSAFVAAIPLGKFAGIVEGFIRSQAAPVAVMQTFHMHLSGELSHERVSPEQLGLAVQQYAANNGSMRFSARYFAGYVRDVKKQIDRGGRRAANATEQAHLDEEAAAKREREREEREGKLLATGRQNHPERFAELQRIADNQVPHKYTGATREYMVHGVLVDLARREWPDAR